MTSGFTRIAPNLRLLTQATRVPATIRAAHPLYTTATLPILSSRTYVSSHTTGSMSETDVRHFPNDASLPGENFEPRQTSTKAEVPPDPSKSLKLSPARQALVDDIIALYSCEPTVERVKRYTPDCVYDDQFVYANDRYKMAGQWFGLPYGFKDSTNHGYEVFRNDKDLIQFKNEQVSIPLSLTQTPVQNTDTPQSWTFKVIPKTARINAIVSVSLDPATVDSDFIRVKFHKDQANDKDYSHEGLGFKFKKWQADNVMKYMDSPEVQQFKPDERAAKEAPRKYGSGGPEGDAPKQDFTT